MSFDLIAKNLLKPNGQNPELGSKEDFLKKLADAGFSDDEILQCIRQEYDATNDTADRKQLLDMVIKIRGLYINKNEERSAPVININIKGNNDRVARMLCPQAV